MRGVPRHDETVRVNLHSSISDPLEQRLELSAGVEQAEGFVDEGGPYLSASWVPRNPWRTLRGSELSSWLANGAYDPSRTVGLLRLDERVLRAFHRAGFDGVIQTWQAQALHGSPLMMTATHTLARSVSPFLLSDAGLAMTEVIPQPPKLRTTTQHRLDKSFRIGLHLDNWERAPLSARGQCGNRICVNLGVEDRFFLFINRTVRGLCAAIKQRIDPLSPKKLGESYLRDHTDHPVARLRVRPGEAYVAPTENLLHDASTEGQTRLDLAITLRGSWAIPR